MHNCEKKVPPLSLSPEPLYSILYSLYFFLSYFILIYPILCIQNVYMKYTENIPNQ